MSFSSDVKKELSQIEDIARHCLIAELSAIVIYEGVLKIRDNQKVLLIQTENYFVLKRLKFLIEKLFNKIIEINDVVEINDEALIDKILSSTRLYDNNSNTLKRVVDNLIISSECCKRAFLRSVFICCGSIIDPQKSYHFELVNAFEKQALQLQEILRFFNVKMKIILRKGYYVLYVKEGEYIVELLNIIYAHKALLEFENLRVLKDFRNNLNRKVNCETANLSRIANSAAKQINDIEYIAKRIGLDSLPPKLEELAELRLKYPEMGLKEIGQMLVEPVGKSGVNHRFKKISDIAESLKEDQS